MRELEIEEEKRAINPINALITTEVAIVFQNVKYYKCLKICTNAIMYSKIKNENSVQNWNNFDDNCDLSVFTFIDFCQFYKTFIIHSKF
jgi:hypothetical protein